MIHLTSRPFSSLAQHSLDTIIPSDKKTATVLRSNIRLCPWKACGGWVLGNKLHKSASQTYLGNISNHNETEFSYISQLTVIFKWYVDPGRCMGPDRRTQPQQAARYGKPLSQRQRGRQMRDPAEASCQFGPGSLFVASGLRLSLPSPFGETRAGKKYQQGDPTMPFSHWDTPGVPGWGHPFYPLRQYQPRPVRTPMASGTPNK